MKKLLRCLVVCMMAILLPGVARVALAANPTITLDGVIYTPCLRQRHELQGRGPHGGFSLGYPRPAVDHCQPEGSLAGLYRDAD